MTPKQELYCQEYLVDLNATKAAERAGYSKHTANEQGARLMATEEVQARIEFLMEERSRKVGVTQDFVLQELLKDVRGCEGTPRTRALELLGKHLHMFNDKLDVNVTLAKKAEEYAKLPVSEQIQLMEQELLRLKGQQNVG